MNTTSRPAPPPVALRARDVADLTVVSGYPCVSVLLPTEPAPRMTPVDLESLQRLVVEVDRQLYEDGVTSRQRLMGRLADQVLRTAAQPTDRSLAIYVSLAVTRAFRLPVTVTARAVVESTFATRALVSTLHRMPPHVVLVIHATCAHLYAAADGGLRPVGDFDPFRGGRRLRIPDPGEPGAQDVRTDLREEYLRGVDQMLGDYRAQHPSPLVLAGSPILLDRFCATSHHLNRLAGRVVSRDQDTALDLAFACTEALESYLRARREDALGQLGRAVLDRPGDVASGIAECWRVSTTRRPSMLLVEENFISPGTPEAPANAMARLASTRKAPPAAVHDLVDDLIEQVILRGGQLALVRDDDLQAHQRIALISRR